MNTRRIRDESIEAANRLGVKVLATLPLFDSEVQMRAGDEIAARILTMHAVAATAYGLNKEKAISWAVAIFGLMPVSLIAKLPKTDTQFFGPKASPSSRSLREINKARSR